jgi:hypothetical protein
VCTVNYSSTASATQTIVASYPGDSTHASSQGATTVSVR